MRLGQWKIRRFALAGELDKMVRITYKFQEELAQRVIRAAQIHGKNITQAYTILDLSNYNVRDHGCLSCMQFHNIFQFAYSTGIKAINIYHALIKVHGFLLNCSMPMRTIVSTRIVFDRISKNEFVQFLVFYSTDPQGLYKMVGINGM